MIEKKKLQTLTFPQTNIYSRSQVREAATHTDFFTMYSNHSKQC